MAAAAPDHDATLTFVSCPERGFPVAAAGGRGVLGRAASADVIVVDSIAAWVLAPWVRPGHGPSLVAMSHQVPGGIDHGPLRARAQTRLDLRTYRRARVLMVASETLAADLRARGFAPESIRVVAPGCDPAPTVDRALPDLRAGRRVAILCVGNWMERKGIRELLDAFAELPAPAATLHLVGDELTDTRYGRAVDERLRSPALADRVVRHGPVDPATVAAMYQAADVFALPSTVEPYGTVIGEALAAGLPVVGWDAGNLPHLATHGRDALIYPVGDVDALAAGLRRLAEDDSTRELLAAGARRRGATLPRWADTAAAFFGILHAVHRRS